MRNVYGWIEENHIGYGKYRIQLGWREGYKTVKRDPE